MADPTASAKSRSRVLIIEDHTLFAESLEVALSLEGYDVRRLPLPEEGGSLATLRSTALRINPRIVLLDLDHTGDVDHQLAGRGARRELDELLRLGVHVQLPGPVAAELDHQRFPAGQLDALAVR